MVHGRTGPGARRSGAAGRMDRRPGRPDRRPGRAPDAGPARAAAASAHRADPRPRRRGVNRRSGGQDGVMTYHVASGTGRLRRVILHRPDLALNRLSPSNTAGLMFGDQLWVRRARAADDGFADVLRDRGVTVHLFGDLLTRTLDIPEARTLVLDRVFDEKEYGPLATDHLRAAFE